MEPKALACVLGSLLINLTLGSFYSIGNITPYIASYMRNNGNPNVSSEQGTWLTATYLLGQGVFLIVGSYIERKFNNRIACIFGCVLHCASTFLTILAIEINFVAVILIYGLGSGSGCGSSYIASIIAAQKWYPRHKGILTGIIVAGFGFGGLIFTYFQTLYINPNNVEPDKAGYFGKSVYERVPNLFLIMGIIFSLAQGIGCILAFPPPEVHHKPQTPQSNNTRSPEATSVTVVDDDKLPEMTNLWAAFSYKIFYVIGTMMMLVAPGITFVNSLGKTFGQVYIKDDRFLATVVALAAIANAFGRVSWGFLINRFSFSTCYILKVLLFASLVSMFPFQFILQNTTLYLIWVLGLFFGFSGVFVLFPVFIEQVFGAVFHGTIYGILYILLAISSIVTSFLIQVIVGRSKGDSNSGGTTMDKPTRVSICLTIAILYLVSLGLYLIFTPYKKIETSIIRKIENEVTNKDSLYSRRDLFPIDKTTLAEKTAKKSDGITRETSLGSIVRFKDVSPQDSKRITVFSV